VEVEKRQLTAIQRGKLVYGHIQFTALATLTQPFGDIGLDLQLKIANQGADFADHLGESHFEEINRQAQAEASASGFAGNLAQGAVVQPDES
jgi:hypothetical protein